MPSTLLRRADDPFEWSEILARGDEAESFLQGQLSQDVTTITHEPVGSLVLTPSSAVLALVEVRRDEQGYVLSVPRELAETAHARLRRFLLRTACTLEVRETQRGPVATIGEQVHRAFPGPREFAGELTPHCFGAQFVASTVSFTKGCFTGQELVARIDARGSSVPWRFVRCVGPTLGQIADVLAHKGPEGPRGVTTAVEIDGVVHALGFIHRSALEGARRLERDGVVVDVVG